MTHRTWLVADLGGTNARFAIADPDTRKITDEAVLPTGSATTLVDLVEQYLQVLDEPTAALDAQAEHEVHELYAERTANAAGQITLLVSHRFSTVRMADLIVVLNNGAIVERGTHQDLMESGGAYAALYESQASEYR
jgi:ABC-type protease/lipase transport system fused ATPase/permease subunit